MKKLSIYNLIVLLAFFLLVATALKGCGGGGGGGGGSSNGGGGSTPEATATIGPTGGVVEVTNSSSPLYGVKVEVPSGALDSNATITITQVDSEPSIPDTAAKVSQTVAMEPDGTIFNKPVSITIPYNQTTVSDENSLQIYTFNGSSWEGVTFEKRDTTANTITALSGHFSKFAVLEPKSSETQTTFDPDVNGFKIDNLSIPGNCAGMVTYAKWFFKEKGCSLYKAYDDETAQEVAKTAQDELSPYTGVTIGDTMKMFIQSDENVFNELIANLKISGPQILGIYEADAEGGANALAHAVLVYGYDDSYGNFYIYDPNYHGEEKVIKWSGQSFQDYYLTSGCSLDPDCYLKKNVDYIVWTSQLYSHSSTMENVFNSFPFYVAGTWNYSNSGTITCTYDGESETESVSGTGSVTISQNDSSVSWTEPTYNVSRSGTITGNNIQVSGKFAVSLVSGVNFTQNSYTANGTICGDEITLSGSGIATGTYEGMSFSCTGTDTATFTRSSSSSSQKTAGEKAIERPSLQFLNKSLKIFTTPLP